MSRNLARNLILLALDWTRPKDPPVSLGQASLIASLKENNIPLTVQSWSVNDENFSPSACVDYIIANADSSSDVAIGAYVWNENAVQTILRQLKKRNFTGRIILGGPQISYVKSGIEKFYPQADIFIRGYAEEALTQFYLSLEMQPEIKGIHYHGHPDKGLSASVNFDSLPSPFLSEIIRPQRFIRWETQRGCPFRCSFCQHKQPDPSMTRRYFSKSRVISEADWITSHPIIQDIAVLDPTFNSGQNYISALHQLIAGKYSGKISFQVRLEMIKPEFLEALIELKKTAKVVIECGIQTIHKEEQKEVERPSNMRKIEEMIKECNKNSIEIELSLIFGLPRQTLKSFSESVEFCKRSGVKKITAFPLMLLRGTNLYDRKEEFNMVESNEIQFEGSERIINDIPHVISSSSFTYADWRKMAELALSLNTN